MTDTIFDKYGDEPSVEDFIEEDKANPKKNKDWTGNKKTVFATLGVSKDPDHKREENDFYATDPNAINRLLALTTIDKTKKVWECACGEGNLSKRLEEFGYTVVSTDLLDRGYGVGNMNFLEMSGENIFDGTILTNPPYKYALEFCKKALQFVTAGNKVYMFLRIQFLETKARGEWFRSGTSGLKTVYVFEKRIGCWMNNKSDTTSSPQAYCWFEFEKGYSGDAVLRWI